MEGNLRYKIAYVQGGGIEALFFFCLWTEEIKDKTVESEIRKQQ